MSLPTGTRLGPYEIVAPLGAGGMGEVYRAHDSRLGREVAVKVLPHGFSVDEERLRRFEQEARAAGALNHPNILGIHDIGTHDGAPYVVSELLEGETLRARIGDSPLPQRKAIDYATQIAKGLAAAHERGIVHRDLKPDNLFVTRDGRVKILDFGLAKIAEPPGGESETKLAAAGAPQTSAGTTLGTVGYMSPEQVRGQNVDHRSDIFSFGVVLYEMLTGRRAFQGDSAVETMNAILKEDPKIAANGGPALPPGLDRIVLHCLEKSPDERFQSARDVAFDIEALSGTSGPSAVKATVSRRSWPRFAIAALIGAVAGAALFAAWRSAAPPPPTPVFQPLTFRRGNVTFARFAPDGRTVVYAARWEGAPLELFSTQPGTPESRPIGLEGDLQAVSTRGELAVLLRNPGGDRTLARMPIGGGAPREVLEQVESADWGLDGDSLAVVHTVNGRDRIEFPIGRTLYEGQGQLSDLAISPKGDYLAFTEHPVVGDTRGDVAVIDLKGKRTVVSAAWEDVFGVHWRPTGDEVWFSAARAGTDHALFAASLSGSVRTVMSAPGSLELQDIASDGRVLVSHGNRRPAVMVHVSGVADDAELTWMDYSVLSDISDDGRRILFSEQGVAGGAGYAVYLRATDRSPAVRLGRGLSQYLSPDGRWALAIDLADNKLVILPTGAGESRTVAPHGIKAYSFAAWFPDGKRLLFAGFEEGKANRMYVQDVDGGAPRAVTPEGIAVASNTLSPDGKWVVAADKDVLTAFPTGAGTPQAIKGAVPADIPIRWRGDGRVLFVGQGRLPVHIFALDVTTGQRTLVHEVTPRDPVGVNVVGAADIRMTPDGHSYAYIYIRGLYNLYQATGLK